MIMKTKKKISKAKNPRKCRTFQVKRKVGKRVIKVTRKICRNPKDSKSEFELYFESSPYFQLLYNKYGNEIDIKSAKYYSEIHNIDFDDLDLEVIRKNGQKRVSTLDFVKQLGY